VLYPQKDLIDALPQ